MYEVSVTREFSAAHFLQNYDGPCANLHGHNWKVEALFRSAELPENGILADFVDIGKILDGILRRLDHGLLNDIPPFDTMNPTAERLAHWLFTQVSNQLPDDAVPPWRINVWETPNAFASYIHDDR